MELNHADGNYSSVVCWSEAQVDELEGQIGNEEVTEKLYG